jgi:glycosyltransferase involved in cell wall biosynthesis
MKIVAISHGYPPFWNMGGEVSLHRTMTALSGEKYVLTKVDDPYVFEGINVQQINVENVLNINSDYQALTVQLRNMKPDVVIGQSELSLAAVNAAYDAKTISIVNVHAPPKFGQSIMEAVTFADYAIYNTQESANLWGEPDGLVVHPPISPLPQKINNNGDAYTLLSSLTNKGVEVVLSLAKLYPNKRFIIVRSPAEKTHGLADLERQAALLPNVELHPRVPPEEVYKYLEQTRILLVPSMYETYGMVAIEAAGYGIPSVHVDNAHVREGIGDAAVLVSPLSLDETYNGIKTIEENYKKFSIKAREKAEWLYERQLVELQNLREFIDNIQKPYNKMLRQRNVESAVMRNKDVH